MVGSRFGLLLTLFTTSAAAWQTYVVEHTDGQDDASVLTAALATGNFSANTTILFEKGKTYNIFTPIKFPVLNNVEVAIEGNLTYPDDMATIQSVLSFCESLVQVLLCHRHRRVFRESIRNPHALAFPHCKLATKEFPRFMVRPYVRTYIAMTF